MTICNNCDQPCEHISGRAFTGYVHSGTGRLECSDGGVCTPVWHNQLTNFDRWNLNVPEKWED